MKHLKRYLLAASILLLACAQEPTTSVLDEYEHQHECPRPEEGYIPAYWYDIVLDEWLRETPDLPPESGILVNWHTVSVPSGGPYIDGAAAYEKETVKDWMVVRAYEHLRDEEGNIWHTRGFAIKLFPVAGTCVWDGDYLAFSGTTGA